MIYKIHIFRYVSKTRTSLPISEVRYETWCYLLEPMPWEELKEEEGRAAKKQE